MMAKIGLVVLLPLTLSMMIPHTTAHAMGAMTAPNPRSASVAPSAPPAIHDMQLRRKTPRWIGSLKTMSDMRSLWRFIGRNKGKVIYISAEGLGEATPWPNGRGIDVKFRIPQDDGYPWVEILSIDDGGVDPRRLVHSKYGVVHLGGFVIPLNDMAGAGYWLWNMQSVKGR